MISDEVPVETPTRLALEVGGRGYLALVDDDGVGLRELVEGEDGRVAGDAQGMGTVADLGDVDVAGLHSRDLGRAALELRGARR